MTACRIDARIEQVGEMGEEAAELSRWKAITMWTKLVMVRQVRSKKIGHI